MNMKKGGRWYE